MSHASEASREANLLGTLSLAVTERVEESIRGAASHSGAAPAALAALSTYLDGSSIDTLRRPLGLSHSAAVRLADRLVAAGLVRREPGVDARSVSIRLTAEGTVVAEAIRRERGAALAELLAPLSTAERAQLARLHEKLLGGLIGGRADARHVCRLCDVEACGHHEGRCPVTHAADRAEGAAA
ncbi:MAG TPA: MarR family transcriptional regulator [Thermoleophilaceae bacterium]|jgi:DNA-binding MarR family transcriptional regulator|nr:MarR family transcriptional regulator [Thermoleophilaceae bacterium]